MTSAARLRRYTPGSCRSSLRVLTAWLGVFCLYVQLAAAAVCAAGGGPAMAAPDATAFPICHGQVDASDHKAPAAPTGHEAPCPFCALHCHTAAVNTSPTGTVATPVSTKVACTTRPAPCMTRTARVLIAAPPRGPPAAP